MLKNTLLILFGAAVMLVAMTLIQVDDSDPEHPAADAASESPTHDNSVSAGADTDAVSNADTSPETAQSVPAQTDFKSSPGQLTPQILSVMIASTVQKLEDNYLTMFDGDATKASILAELAAQKMERDMALMDLVNNGGMSAKDTSLMAADMEGLSPEDLERKMTLTMELEQRVDLMEENRIEFEDKLRNVLSSSELDAFRRQEAETARDLTKKRAESWVMSMRVNLPDLNDYQRSELDRIVDSFSKSQPELVPIGATVGTDFMFGSDGKGPSQELYGALSSVLSDEQAKRFRSAPTIVTN